MPSEKGWFEVLVDFSFQEFLTTRSFKILYALHLLVGLVVAIAVVLSGFRDSAAQGLLALILCVVGLFFWTLYVRIALELLLVIFRIGEHIGQIAKSASSQ